MVSLESSPELEEESPPEGEEAAPEGEETEAEHPGIAPTVSSDDRIRFDDGEEDSWSPPSLMQLGEEADEEQDSTEVLVEWVLDDSD